MRLIGLEEMQKKFQCQISKKIYLVRHEILFFRTYVMKIIIMIITYSTVFSI